MGAGSGRDRREPSEQSSDPACPIPRVRVALHDHRRVDIREDVFFESALVDGSNHRSILDADDECGVVDHHERLLRPLGGGPVHAVEHAVPLRRVELDVSAFQTRLRMTADLELILEDRLKSSASRGRLALNRSGLPLDQLADFSVLDVHGSDVRD